MIISTLPVHLHTIQEIFDASKNMHRKIVIMGKKLQNIVSMAIEEGYLKVDKSLIGDLSDLESEKSILLYTDEGNYVIFTDTSASAKELAKKYSLR